MAVSKRARFDVFKRDKFTCAYCGRRPPEVTLEVDHIIPVIEGGTDDRENLITACFDCNRGKAHISLDSEPPAVPDLEERAELIRDREAQLRVYNAAKAEERERRDADFERVWNYWFEVWNATTLERWYTPWESSLRKYIDTLGVEEVIEAITITRGRFGYVTTNAVKYFVGVLRRKQAKLEGRVVQCAKCGKDLVLEPDDDPRLEWFHGPCFPADQEPAERG